MDHRTRYGLCQAMLCSVAVQKSEEVKLRDCQGQEMVRRLDDRSDGQGFTARIL